MFKKMFILVFALLSTLYMAGGPTTFADTQSPELLVNPGFENGTTGWDAQLATLTPDTTQAHSGGSALKIANRSKDWSAAVQNVTAALRSYGAGHYRFSAYVKLAAPLGSGSCSPLLVIKYNDGADHYATTSRAAINENGYAKLEGTVDISWNGSLNYAQLYVQTGTGGTECLADLYVDDFSLVNTDRSTPLPPPSGDSSVNLALNKPVTASGTLDSIYSPSSITDGDTDTANGPEWAADVSQGPQWLVIDFGSNATFNRLEFYTRTGFEQKEYEIQYWDGTGWINLMNKVTGNTSDHLSYVFKTVTAAKLRIYMTEGNVNEQDVARIVEVEAYHDPNLALNGAVTASSTQNDAYSPSYITDGTEDTVSFHGWAADVSQGPQWVVIDFGRTVTFSRVEFFTKNQYEQAEYEIQYWDGTDWIDCFPKVTNNTTDHNSHLFAPVSSSKLRVYMTEGNVQQPTVARINQVEVYNTTGVYSEYIPDPIPQDPNDRQEKTEVGAIRWDWWGATADPSNPGSETQMTLSPDKYHFRLPWYASVTGTDSVSIPLYTQEIVDQEIAYAKEAGIDYWAFVMYESPTARDLYLSSAHKDDVKWSAILGASGFSLNNYPWLVSQFKTSNYEKVLNGRPLVYVWSTNKTIVDTLRSESERQGVPEPYIVIMGASGKVMKQMEGDALSSYVNPVEGGAPYSDMIANDRRNWDLLAGYGVQVVPTVSTGWDPRPRIDHPVSWTSYGASSWAQTATPDEIAENLQNALDWNDSHRSSSIPNAILMYAWNENDEGGWILPTLGTDGQPDTGRLDAIRSVLRPDVTPPAIAIAAPEPGSYETADVLTPQIQVTDAESGVDAAQTVILLDGQPIRADADLPLYTLSLGTHVMKVTAVDQAGNPASQSVSFRIETSVDSVKKLLTIFTAEGWIENNGILTGLQQKLEHGDLKAFINEVSAQEGKHIEDGAAHLLLRDANQLKG
ncbi:discoidin domain-containing protein [Cohnella zeiphila]|uniref:Discoidin domain-containing protein n=1 Tax=Cohnella zeiphila TaxID=2761120 RepID=A0A7X0SLE7_9BACL|nr:discoidin domain-containing protein [Cohnella zeiphila]MBB6732163.1 discoidin domain-containing protein [Cohnella zeiphila]